MKFRNRIIFVPSIILIFIFLLYIPYEIGKIEYIIFGGIGFTICAILYIFAIFEYFQVEENKLIYVNPLRMIRKEIPWNEIVRIYVYSDNVLKAVKIGYGTLTEKEITIDFVIKDYKKLIKMILDKVEGNEKVSIDIKIDDFIK